MHLIEIRGAIAIKLAIGIIYISGIFSREAHVPSSRFPDFILIRDYRYLSTTRPPGSSFIHSFNTSSKCEQIHPDAQHPSFFTFLFTSFFFGSFQNLIKKRMLTSVITKNIPTNSYSTEKNSKTEKSYFKFNILNNKCFN